MNLYRDRNANGLLDSADLLVRCVDTDENGQYTMPRLEPGAYLVDVLEQTLPAGMAFVSGGSAIRPVSVAALQISGGHHYGYNHTASIAVGTQQPVQSGQTITTGGNISSNIQYKDTGVNLTVTPSVNSGNMVAMTLNQSVTDVGSIDSATGQRAFLQRQIGSKVAVRSGETIVLGGLIRDNTAFGRSGIPFLSDLPLIGNAFGTSSKAGARTELLVMITPQVVRADNEIRAVANDLRDRMKAIRHDRESFFPNAPLDWTPGIPKEKRP